MKLKLDKDNEELGTDQDGNRYALVDGLWKRDEGRLTASEGYLTVSEAQKVRDESEGGTMTSVDFNEENDSPAEGGELAPDDPTQVAREAKEDDPNTTATPTELASGGNSTGDV